MHDGQARLALGLAVVVVALAALWTYGPEGDDRVEGTVVAWEIEPGALTRVTVRAAEHGSFGLLRAGDGWTIEHLGASRSADAWAAQDLVRELEDRGDAVLVAEPGADGSPFGLPGATVTLVAGDAPPVEIEVGREAPGGWKRYLRLSDGRIVASEARFDRVLVDPSSLRDRRVLDFPAAEVSRVVLTGPQGTLDVNVDSSGMWWLEGYGRALPDAVDDLVMGLLAVRIERFEALPEQAPERTARVELRDGRVLVLESGPTTGEGVPVRGPDGLSGWVPPPALALLGQGPTDLADPLAFPLPEEGALTVVIEAEGSRTALARDAEGWARDGAVDPSAGDQARRLGRVPARYRQAPVPSVAPIGRIDVETETRSWSWGWGAEVEPGLSVVEDSRGGDPYLVPTEELRAAVAP